MRDTHKLNKIDYSDLPKLVPGRPVDRLIAENVLRYRWCSSDRFGRRCWIRGRNKLGYLSFKPSSEISWSLAAIEMFVDRYGSSKDSQFRIEMYVTARKHWTVRSILVLGGDEHEVARVVKKELPMALCLTMLVSYLKYGPKDYSKRWRF